MALIEIDQNEYETSVAAKNLLLTLEKDPRTRKKIFDALKTLNPDAKLPVDFVEKEALEEHVTKEVSSARQKAEEVDAKMQEFLAAQRSQNERLLAHEKLRKDGWDAEGIAEIEKTMVAKGIPDYDVAAAYYEKSLPKASPAAASGIQYDKGWNLTTPDPSDDATKDLFVADPARRRKAFDAFTRNEVQKWSEEQRRMGNRR
jgi:hypothetical protein